MLPHDVQPFLRACNALHCIIIEALPGACLLLMYSLCAIGRYRIERELGTEIKAIPPTIEKSLYCS